MISVRCRRFAVFTPVAHVQPPAVSRDNLAHAVVVDFHAARVEMTELSAAQLALQLLASTSADLRAEYYRLVRMTDPSTNTPVGVSC